VSTTTVLIIDHHPVFSLGLRGLLEAQQGEFAVVAEATDGHEGLQLAAAHDPGLVLVNAEVDGLRGLEAIRTLRQQRPATAVVVVSAQEDQESLFYAIKYGAAAYLLKTAPALEVVQTLRRVAAGEFLINETVLSKPHVAQHLLDDFRSLATTLEAGEADVQPLFIPLSGREVEVLDSIAKGNSNKEIARCLGISDQTVKNHITSIMRKLAVNDRTQAVVYALRHGWIKA
jgi:DNA-binding NarL/FixJ family response regulator